MTKAAQHWMRAIARHVDAISILARMPVVCIVCQTENGYAEIYPIENAAAVAEYRLSLSVGPPGPYMP
jgi:hypothetical protein